MEDKDKKIFDALETLRSAAWNSFAQRRPFEWQISLAAR
jgi:hypothetical protein